MFPKSKLLSFSVLFLILINQISYVISHGRLMEPIARGSRWRFNVSAPIDYNDNEGFCGGFMKHHGSNDGKCGLCGNDYENPEPRKHELGGIYGEGVIVKSYESGSEIDIGVLLTANHRGYFIFDLCNIDESKKESEDCFSKNILKLKDGQDKYQVERTETGWFNTTLIIPNEVQCDHCVLRWSYTAGNNWGTCENGSTGLGCGPQETFKGCSDISIH